MLMLCCRRCCEDVPKPKIYSSEKQQKKNVIRGLCVSSSCRTRRHDSVRASLHNEKTGKSKTPAAAAVAKARHGKVRKIFLFTANQLFFLPLFYIIEQPENVEQSETTSERNGWYEKERGKGKRRRRLLVESCVLCVHIWKSSGWVDFPRGGWQSTLGWLGGLSVENGAKCEPHDTRQRRWRRRGRGNVCVETMRNVVMIEVTEIRKLNFTVDFTTLAPLTRSSRGTTISGVSGFFPISPVSTASAHLIDSQINSLDIYRCRWWKLWVVGKIKCIVCSIEDIKFLYNSFDFSIELKILIKIQSRPQSRLERQRSNIYTALIFMLISSTLLPVSSTSFSLFLAQFVEFTVNFQWKTMVFFKWEFFCLGWTLLSLFSTK